MACSSIFDYSTKMDQSNRIQFCVKNEMKFAKTFEMLTVTFGDYEQNTNSIAV